MQTFLPYADFNKTVECLDYRRLGKMRIEAMQIYRVITGQAKPNKSGKVAWSSHPAVRMWRNHEDALAIYHNSCIKEWIKRGYKNNMSLIEPKGKIIYPHWLGDEKFHALHRGTLLFKNYEWYSQFGWEEEPKYEYIWPE